MTKKTYTTTDFRAEAVKLVLEQGLSQPEAAQRLAIPKGSLSNWVVAARRAGIGPVSGEPTVAKLLAENARLRRQLAQAEMAREIVREAAAYFAKESLQGTRS